MMYDEFIQKSGMTVTVDYYETVIQPLYYAMPHKMIKDASAFCNWIKTVGLDIAEAIYTSYNDHAGAVYESVFTEEELRARLIAQLSTEDLIAARINRRD